MKEKREIINERGARSSISKEMKVINHTSVVQQSLTERTEFSIVSVVYDNTNYFNYSWCLSNEVNYFRGFSYNVNEF